MTKKIGMLLIIVLAIICAGTYYLQAGQVEEIAPVFQGYEQAGNYWVKVFINDVRGRIAVQLLNKYGEAEITGIPEIKGEVIFIDGTKKEVVFRPEHIYWNENEDTYSGIPVGYSSTYYVMGNWIKGIGCVDTTVTIEGKELKFTCQSH